MAAGVDDYYAGRGESPGIWAGGGAELLGLAGVVEEGDLGTLLQGVDPASGARLRSPVRARRITVRTLDTDSGEWHEEQKRLAPVSGYDLVFSCPKSVSLLHALTDDDHMRTHVSEAHETAWQAALAYLEREACVVRRGHAGAIRERGDGFVAAAFRHRTSRAQDPHLHTHVIVANLARAADGQWRALDGRALLQTYRLAAGYLYEAHLRHELSRRLGVEWTAPVKGMGELQGVPDEAMREFSTRRRSLLEHMEALGSDGFIGARIAALATREAKEHVDLPRLQQEWQARAAEHGLGRGEFRELIGPPRCVAGLDLDGVARHLLGSDGLTARGTTFTLPELVRAVAGAARDGGTVDAILEAAEELSVFPLVALLEPNSSPGRPARFTTRELIDLEHEALQLAIRREGACAPRVRVHAPATLALEQRDLVWQLCLRPDRVICVVGVAGSGKTTALGVVADSYARAGIPVLGAAPSGRAADELSAATGIHSRTLHRLLLDASRDGGLPHRSVVVVDEAGMAETRVLAPLLRLVHEAEGKAILVGDPGQLSPVGAGGLFPALCDRLGAVRLQTNRRQLDPAERDALVHLRSGNPEPYLTHAASGGRLHIADEPIAAKQRLLEDWWQAAERDLASTVMLAYRRDDARELNLAARALLSRAGRLGPNTLAAGEHEFSVGDRVICRQNDGRLNVRNGTRGTIVTLDPSDSTITLQADTGPPTPVPLEYAAKHVEHAYALTGHAVQGATLERAFVLLEDTAALREWGYVACSRARTETRLYLSCAAPEHDAHAPAPNAGAPPERLARALSASSAERLAVDQWRAPSEASVGALAAARRHAERAQSRAKERLAAAEAKRKQLGWRGRRKHGFELETEIALQRSALRLADAKLNQLAAAPLIEPHPADRETPMRDRVRLRERAHSRELVHERDAPGIDLGG